MKTKQGKKRESEKSPVSNVSKARETQDSSFPIIGLGASAGGLEVFERFFRQVPPDSGMAFVLVSHLDPGHASMLTEILQRITAMPVVEAQDRMAVAPNSVYVIPPNRYMAIFRGNLHLSVPEASRGPRMPIDFFLRSLAEETAGEATDGVEAAVLVRKTKPDAVVLVLQMPKLSGLEILPRIKEVILPPLVAALTNFSTGPLKVMCIRKGADFFFDKSTEFEKAISVIESESDARAHALS
jgi:chemotaxis response regulator CheB